MLSPVVKADATYVTNGTSKLIDFIEGKARNQPSLMTGKNADIWQGTWAALESGTAAAASKVKAHVPAESVARGEYDLHDYLGNCMADVTAKVAANISRLSDIELDWASKVGSTVFLMAVRIGIIEARVHQVMQEGSFEWLLYRQPSTCTCL